MVYHLPSRKSPRLKNWDYSSSGYYFVTTVTKNRMHIFGEIKNGKMILNEFGKIASEEWNKSFEIRKELSCDTYIIMPNHIHAILICRDRRGFRRDRRRPVLAITNERPVGDERPYVPKVDIADVETKTETDAETITDTDVETITDTDAETITIADAQPRVPTAKSISSFFAGYKSAVTKRINELRKTPKQPVWQSRFHDRIIRDENELYNIRNYILNNPMNWKEDRDFYDDTGMP